MNFLVYNLSWMVFNVILALIPVLLTYILDFSINKYLRYLLIVVWFLYLPNSIYLITDLQYLPDQLIESGITEKLFLVIQYAVLIILGITSYMFSLKPFAKLIQKNKILRKNKEVLFVSLNFLVAFAVILGKFQRTHSLFVFTDPIRVVDDVLKVFSSMQLMLFVLFFGIIINIIYIYLRPYFLKNNFTSS